MDSAVSYYDVLQVSPTADPETVQGVYRALAQRFDPDNKETGDAERFRQVHEAYTVLGDADRRAQYDATPAQGDAKAGTVSNPIDSDFELEQSVRLRVLETLYAQRRLDPNHSGLYDQEIGERIGVPPERLEFTGWYLREKGLAKRAMDASKLSITADGVDYLEKYLERNARRRLNASKPAA
jgi:curved DNA-binding protein CbpA